MAIFEIKTELPPDAVAALEDLLAEREEQRLMVVEDKPSGRAWLTGYFASQVEAAAAWEGLAEAMPANWIPGDPVVRQLPEEDWKSSYKAHFKAWKFGRLNWVPVWERDTFVVPAGEEVLWLDPGMAFGTGNHETTRLCCERLAQFAAARGSQGRVIDAGCGSGILALSAAKLGFGQAAGFDNDPEAIRVSEENAMLNGLAGHVDFAVGDLVSGLANRSGELVLANIQADVLMRFASELCAAVAPGGQLVLSGILGQELATVRAKFADVAAGWAVESRELGEWADLALTSPA
ncbi:MAG: 50S ribosomal protein L11 methyltransferase [Opitutae bacterium]|nr:50S ribosomal protein L11 methyltransferase [Opitutae bacterium]